MYWFPVLLLMMTLQIEIVPENLVWRNRVLIYLGDGDFSPWLSKDQMSDLSERKLLIFHFKEDVLVNSNFERPIQENAFLKKLSLDSSVKRKWVLIGLDGGIKKSGNSLPFPADVYRIIDAMPMRQSEVKK